MTDTPAPPAPFVRPDVAAFLHYLNNQPGPSLEDLDAPAARALYLAAKDLTDPPLGELAIVRDLSIPGPTDTIPARLFDARADRAPGPAVVFAHGGGFVLGDLDTHASLCAEMARVLDLPVVAVDYRLAPEHRWPAAPDDVEAAARWVAESPAALGRHVTSLVLAGDSAGGCLAVLTAIALRDAPARVPAIVQALIYPVIDGRPLYPSYAEFGTGYLLTATGMARFADAYRADHAHPRGAPIHAEPAGLPAAVIVTAGLDPLRDEGRAFAARLAQAGVPVTYREAAGIVHGFATLRRAIPSAAGDLAGFLAVLRPVVTEAETARAAGETTA